MWLNRLEMPEYIETFHHHGYEFGKDIENIKKITEDDLKAMGIRKKGTVILCEYNDKFVVHDLYVLLFIIAHIQRLNTAITNLVNPTPCKLPIYKYSYSCIVC